MQEPIASSTTTAAQPQAVFMPQFLALFMALFLALSGALLTGCSDEPADEPFKSDVPPPPETAGDPDGPTDAEGDGVMPGSDADLGENEP